MKKFLVSVLANSIALLLIDYLSAAINFNDSIKTVIVLAFVITVLNATVKPLLQVLSLPATIVTLGLFRFVVNGVVILMAFNLTDGAAINGLWPAICVSIALSILTGFIEKLFGQEK